MRKYRMTMVVCFGLLVAASGCVSGNCGTVPAETVRDVQNQAAYEEMLNRLSMILSEGVNFFVSLKLEVPFSWN